MAKVGIMYLNSVRPHAVTATTAGWAFGYDANGNMTSRTVSEGTFDLAYTWENQLPAITATTGLTVTRCHASPTPSARPISIW